MRRVVGGFAVVVSWLCTSCFTGGGQSGTEADDLAGHDAAVDGGASTTNAVTSANGGSENGETSRESTSPDASVSGATEGETNTRDETAEDTSSSERGITVPSPPNTSGERATSNGPVTTDDHTTADGRATSDVATGSSNDDGAASSTDADPHATDSDTEAYFFTAPFDPQRQIVDLTPPRAPVDHPAGDCVGFGGDCSATFECRRDFELNGIDAVINAPLFIDCTLEEPSLGWQCDCDGAEYAVFTVQADDAAGACAAAAAPCQQYQRQFAQEALAR